MITTNVSTKACCDYPQMKGRWIYNPAIFFRSGGLAADDYQIAERFVWYWSKTVRQSGHSALFRGAYFFDFCESFVLGSEFSDFLEVFVDVVSVVERLVDVVEVGVSLGIIFFDTVLHSDALEQCLGEFRDACSPLRLWLLCYGFIEDGGGLVDGVEGADLVGVFEDVEGLFFEAGFIVEPGLDVGVVICAVEGLLESPVELFLRRGVFLHILEEFQGFIDAVIFCQRADPVSFEGEEAPGEFLPVPGADEVRAVLFGDLLYVHAGVPSEAAPEDFVEVVVASLAVTYEADSIFAEVGEYAGMSEGSGVYRLTSQGFPEGPVPVEHGVGATCGVRDIGIPSYRVAWGEVFSEPWEGDGDCWSEYDASSHSGLSFWRMSMNALYQPSLFLPIRSKFWGETQIVALGW